MDIAQDLWTKAKEIAEQGEIRQIKIEKGQYFTSIILYVYPQKDTP